LFHYLGSDIICHLEPKKTHHSKGGVFSLPFAFYSQIGLQKKKIEDHLVGKVKGLEKNQCFSRHTTEKKRDGSGYTGTAEILQLCDLLTSSTRDLCCSFYGVENTES